MRKPTNRFQKDFRKRQSIVGHSSRSRQPRPDRWSSGNPSVNLFAAEARLELEDPAYEALYNNFKGRFMKDPRWVE